MTDFFNLPSTVTFCEQPLDFWIKRPYYLISNLPFIFLGFYFWSQKTNFARIFAVLTTFIGLASSLYDTTYTLWAQLIDLFGMFSFVTFLILHNINLGKNLTFGYLH